MFNEFQEKGYAPELPVRALGGAQVTPPQALSQTPKKLKPKTRI